jgi:hypothetical protein
MTCYVRGRKNGSIKLLVRPDLPTYLTDIQQEILVGSLLGDGCLFKTQPGTLPFLSITRKTGDIEYLKWEHEIFKDFCASPVTSRDIFDKRTHKIYHQSKMVTRKACVFESYYNKWYPSGKKLIPKDLVLSTLICSIWFCDDGCLNKHHNNRFLLKLSTHGFSVSDVKFLKRLLEARYKEKFLRNKQENFIYASDNAAKAFLRDISVNFPIQMLRKAKWIDENGVNLLNIPQKRSYNYRQTIYRGKIKRTFEKY